MAGLQQHHANYTANDWLKAVKKKFLWVSVRTDERKGYGKSTAVGLELGFEAKK